VRWAGNVARMGRRGIYIYIYIYMILFGKSERKRPLVSSGLRLGD
jgi:hypothetical protein